jgi:hypothetical protein
VKEGALGNVESALTNLTTSRVARAQVTRGSTELAPAVFCQRRSEHGEGKGV